jgi:type IX secretion system PorP/SprF family membrane protein
MRATKFISVVIFTFSFFISEAQDIHFSQFYTSPALLNPAAAGTADRGFRAVLNYKNQWRSVSSSSAYNTVALAADKAFLKDKSLGAGLSFYNDKAGDSKIQTNQVNGMIAANKSLNAHNNFSLGLQAGFVQKTINYSALTWGNQFDGSDFDKSMSSGETNQKTSITYLDLATGFQWKLKVSKKFKMVTGISAWHLTTPKNSFSGVASEKLAPRISVTENMTIAINNQLSFLPSILFQSQGKNKELLIGGLFRYTVGQESHFTGVKTSSAIYFGGHVRAKDSFILAALFDIHHWVTMGLSYDITTSSLTTANSSKGGLEISLGIPVNGEHSKTTSSVKFQ